MKINAVGYDAFLKEYEDAIASGNLILADALMENPPDYVYEEEEVPCQYCGEATTRKDQYGPCCTDCNTHWKSMNIPRIPPATVGEEF